MKVVKISSVKTEEPIGNLFKGEVRLQRIVDEKMAKDLRVTAVTFSPGARNVLHTHTYEQVLYVIDGFGIVATKSEQYVVTSGTVIFIPLGEPHLHGATPDAPFSHISVTMGDGQTVALNDMSASVV
jgi:quercetin dioxygenase-like cupin family protein